jgi:hypothetical protein
MRAPEASFSGLFTQTKMARRAWLAEQWHLLHAPIPKTHGFGAADDAGAAYGESMI